MPESSRTDGFISSAVTVFVTVFVNVHVHVHVLVLGGWPQGLLVWLPLNGQTERVNGFHNQVVGKK